MLFQNRKIMYLSQFENRKIFQGAQLVSNAHVIESY